MQSCEIDITNVKDEFSTNHSSISFCQACLSTDRVLSNVTEYADIFNKICDLQNVSPPTNGYLCWECIALLKKMRNFAKMVADAQELLQICYLSRQNPFPHSLSNLTITQQDPTTFVYEPIVQVIKIEPEQDAFHNDDNFDYATDDVKQDIKQELDDVPEVESALDTVEIKIELVTDTVKKSYKNSEEALMKSNLKRQAKYRYINTRLRKHRGYVMKKISIEVEEAMSMLEKERSSSVFLLAEYKCVSCVAIIDNEQELLDHNKKHHDVSAGHFVCHVCQTRCLTPEALHSHVSSHGVCRQCRACAWRGVTSRVAREHVEEHHNMVQCIACGVLFKHSRAFYKHYHAIHSVYVCDFCGQRNKSRDMIIRHLRHHYSFECRLCKKYLKNYRSYNHHMAAKHNNTCSDEPYCVTCDRWFKSHGKYRQHLKDAAAHAKERNESRDVRIPCPDCGKTYAKKTYMKNHYNLVHLKKSKYYCALCDKYFLDTCRLRNHQKYYHEKQPKPKDKLCKYCGRGFHTNRMVTQHIRTHTGERPFVCTQCPAAFTQKQALVGHVRKAHK